MPTFKLTLAYDGTGFVGWQRQADGTSVQGQLEDALSELDGRPVAVTGAGRTDAGVHACGQVAHAALERTIDPDTVRRAVNVRLPPAIRVLDVDAVPPEFHARFDARVKSYQYRVWNADVLNPFERLYGWHVSLPRLDAEAMAAAAASLVGRHDFAAFQGAGSESRDTVRTVFSSRVQVVAPSRLLYDVSGDGFLRHMVRNIVGTLVEVGRGRRPVAWIRDVLDSRDRAQAGPTAPPEGLFLLSVEYGPADPRW
jgi:tRNA pseudouridine38-40 synthase